MVRIRKAQDKDLNGVADLLMQVLAIHAEIRPDIFIAGTKKYSDEEILELFRDETKPVFIAAGEDDEVLGYAICEFRGRAHPENMQPIKTLFIDDLCVDGKARGQHIGRALYEHVCAFAKEQGCYHVTLNVWEGNDSARAFYEKMGFGIMETTMEKIL
ncbi:MAG: GNAT family N-acetyltransferase [Solobacterium sp.]|nr:GNAT family N-acetyltransferase [Solobacterium sp.]